MGVDRGYGSGAPLSAATSASRRRRAASANLRKKNIKRVNQTTMSPIAKIGRFLADERVSGTLALAAGAAAGFTGLRAQRASATAGARPMTTAERSASVTRAGRGGVGYIGSSIKPRAPRYDQEGGDYPGIADEPWNSYDSAYARAESIYRRKYGKGVNTPSQWSEGYAGSNYPSLFFDDVPGGRVMSPNWALQTAAARRGLGNIRSVSSVRRRSPRNR
jgi:hypothetical protein